MHAKHLQWCYKEVNRKLCCTYIPSHCVTMINFHHYAMMYILEPHVLGYQMGCMHHLARGGGNIAAHHSYSVHFGQEPTCLHGI